MPNPVLVGRIMQELQERCKPDIDALLVAIRTHVTTVLSEHLKEPPTNIDQFVSGVLLGAAIANALSVGTTSDEVIEIATNLCKMIAGANADAAPNN